MEVIWGSGCQVTWKFACTCAEFSRKDIHRYCCCLPFSNHEEMSIIMAVLFFRGFQTGICPSGCTKRTKSFRNARRRSSRWSVFRVLKSSLGLYDPGQSWGQFEQYSQSIPSARNRKVVFSPALPQYSVSVSTMLTVFPHPRYFRNRGLNCDQLVASWPRWNNSGSA